MHGILVLFSIKDECCTIVLPQKNFSLEKSLKAQHCHGIHVCACKLPTATVHIMTFYSTYELHPATYDSIFTSFFFRSPDLLNSEASLSLSECRSSSDSNKASSGEVSPYDNNSPVLSERRGGDLAKEREVHSGRVLSTERLFCVPEQYSLVGQVTGRSRDTVSNIWAPTKGEIEQLY